MCLEDLLIRNNAKWATSTKVVSGAGSGLLLGPNVNRIALEVQLLSGTLATTFLGPGELPSPVPSVGLTPSAVMSDTQDASLFGLAECPWWFVAGGACTFLISERIVSLPLEELVKLKMRMWPSGKY